MLEVDAVNDVVVFVERACDQRTANGVRRSGRRRRGGGADNNNIKEHARITMTKRWAAAIDVDDDDYAPAFFSPAAFSRRLPTLR